MYVVYRIKKNIKNEVNEMIKIETYGKRTVWKNPFKRRSGWIVIGHCKGLVRQMKMAGMLR